MDNLIAAAKIETLRVEGIDIRKEQRQYLLAFSLNQILRSMNEVTITSKDRIVINFDTSDSIGTALKHELFECVWDIVLRMFGRSCSDPLEQIKLKYSLGITIDVDSWNYNYSISIPKSLLLNLPTMDEPTVRKILFIEK